MRISDWSSDVCSSDLLRLSPGLSGGAILSRSEGLPDLRGDREYPAHDHRAQDSRLSAALPGDIAGPTIEQPSVWYFRSEEHTSELQSLMRISYAVFCLKKNTRKNNNTTLLSQSQQHHSTTAKTHYTTSQRCYHQPLANRR